MRNPSLLLVSPTGYGGADTSGEETMVISYLVDATRGKGMTDFT